MGEEEERISASCKLPGAKPKAGESMEETLQRVLETKLTPFCAAFKPQQTEESFTEEKSKSFGVNTRYLQLRYTGAIESIDKYLAATYASEQRTLSGPRAAGSSTVS